MSVEKQEFDVKRAEKELKKCPKIVKEYFKHIKRHSENWKILAQVAQLEMRRLKGE